MFAGSRQIRVEDEAKGLLFPVQAELLLDRVPDRGQVTWREIENAGHFSFLSPFPPQMRNPDFLPSTDPAGFDRERLHERLPGEILDFLDERLK
ncbi:MAG: hypothetical protein ACJ76N_01240 [Thermoanaerobaculia bacterium]